MCYVEKGCCCNDLSIVWCASHCEWLSTFLQTENLNFTDVPHKVDSAVNKLHILIDQLGDRGNNDHLTFSKIDDAFLEVIDRTSLQRRLRGNQLHNDMDYSPERFLMETGIPFSHRLLGEIEDAFHHRCWELLGLWIQEIFQIISQSWQTMER